MLSDAQQQQLAEVLGEWATYHPRADEPLVSAGTIALSPREIAEAASAPETPAGQMISRLFSICEC